MAYSFTRQDESVEAGLRRLARDQIETALDEGAADSDLSMAERIHQVRKRCKKLRGLIRLVRPAFADYKCENAAFRTAAGRLSDVRDAAALVETCDRLGAHFSDQLSDQAFAGLREILSDEARAREEADDVGERLRQTCDDLRDAQTRASRWTLSAEGADAVTGGLRKTYGRARTAMAAAREDPTGERLHDWRKRVKYHWYHLRLLKNVSPVLAAQIEPADALSDLLGDHHDLVVMSATLDRIGARADPAAAEAFRGLMAERRRNLKARAFRLGDQVLPETPKALARRAGAYWRGWQADDGANIS